MAEQAGTSRGGKDTSLQLAEPKKRDRNVISRRRLGNGGEREDQSEEMAAAKTERNIDAAVEAELSKAMGGGFCRRSG